VSLVIHASRVPLLPGAADCVRAGFIPGGLRANREFAECLVKYQGDISEEVKTLLFDPQTAGGLLISVAEHDAALLVDELKAKGVDAFAIGEVTSQTKPLITVSL
jgi:selenide,water dikinase